jgi:phosphopantothenate synthetase
VNVKVKMKGGEGETRKKGAWEGAIVLFRQEFGGRGERLRERGKRKMADKGGGL